MATNSNQHIALSLLLLFFFLCGTTSGEGNSLEEPLVRAEGASAEEFQAWLEVHPDVRTLWHHEQELQAKSAESKTLKRLLVEAQKLYLSAPLDQARRGFSKLAGLSLQSDWSEAQRRALFQSQLRGAQLAKSPEEQKNWMKQATCFAPELNPDATLFPPQLISTWKTTIKSIPKHKVSLKNSFDRVLVNGKKRAAGESFFLCEQKYRFSWQAYHLKSQTRIASWQEINAPPAERQPLASGSCEWPRAHEKGFRVFYNPKCILSANETKTMEPKTPSSLRLNPTSEQIQESHLLPTQKLSTKPKPLWKHKWFWVTTGVIVTGVVIAQSQKKTNKRKKEEVEPTHEEGL